MDGGVAVLSGEGGVAVLSGEGKVAVLSGGEGVVTVLSGMDGELAVLSDMNEGAVDACFVTSDNTDTGVAGMIVSLCSCWTGSIEREPVTLSFSLDAMI